MNNETERFKKACFEAQKEIARIEKQRDNLVTAGRKLMHFLENETTVDIESEYTHNFIKIMSNAIDDEKEKKILGVPILFQNTI